MVLAALRMDAWLDVSDMGLHSWNKSKEEEESPRKWEGGNILY